MSRGRSQAGVEGGNALEADLIAEWVARASSAEGVSRLAAEQYLKADSVSTGMYCFRSSSSDRANVVLCVRVVSGQVAHMRTQATPASGPTALL